MIFRVRSAKMIKITDMHLLRRLGIIVAGFAVFLGIRTLVAPPIVIVGRTADDLKAYLCRNDWWDHSFTGCKFKTSSKTIFREKIQKIEHIFLQVNEKKIEKNVCFNFSVEVLFLIWGIRLCIMVRKAPSEFNESRFISMAIYNEFLLSVFLKISM